MAKRVVIDTERLRTLYLEQNLSIKAVAAALGVGVKTAHKAIKASEFTKTSWAAWRRLDIKQLTELLITRNLSEQEVAVELGVSLGTIRAAVRHHNLQKSKEAITALRQKSTTARYGVAVPLHSDELRARAVATNQRKYGCDHVTQAEEVVKKIRDTKLQRYGRPGHPTTSTALAKRAITNKRKYGVGNYAQRSRSADSIAATENESTLRGFIKGFISDNGRKPVTAELAELLELSPSSMQALLKKWELYHLVEQFRSRYEVELAELFPTDYVNTRSAVKGHELDLYYPEQGLAIEFHGLYRHSHPWKSKNYHRDKYLACRQAGIRLVQIFEDEWLFSRDIVTSKLNRLLRSTSPRTAIGARLCSVQELSAEIASKFMKRNHVQGFCRGRYFGLVHDLQPVAVMILNKPQLSRNVGELTEGLEISRFATAIDKSIPGAFPKLLKVAKEQSSRLFTYADLRWVDPDRNIYVLNGFSPYNEVPPAYWYWTSVKYPGYIARRRYYRFGFTKTKIRQRFSDYLPSESITWTEDQLMSYLGWHRIYDAGKISYELACH